jgi:hypothetical protein
VAEDQIAMTLEGQWRSYAITLAWSPSDETLRLICTFELEPPEERMGALYELLNRMNDLCWAGAFTWWGEEKLWCSATASCSRATRWPRPSRWTP